MHGVCSAPGHCICQGGYTGLTCDTELEPGELLNTAHLDSMMINAVRIYKFSQTNAETRTTGMELVSDFCVHFFADFGFGADTVYLHISSENNYIEKQVYSYRVYILLRL